MLLIAHHLQHKGGNPLLHVRRCARISGQQLAASTCSHTGLALEDCSLPMASLPALRPAMGQLASLRVDLRHHDFPDGAQDEELESVLLLLCRPHAGALPLRSLECSYLPDWMELVDVQERVLQQLATDLGETGVHLCLMHE